MTPLDSRLRKAQIRQRKSLCTPRGLYPPDYAQQHVFLSGKSQHFPHPVSACGHVAQELMRLPLPWLAQV